MRYLVIGLFLASMFCVMGCAKSRGRMPPKQEMQSTMPAQPAETP